MSLPNRTFAKLDFPTPVVPSTTIRGSGKFDSFGAKKLGRVESYLFASPLFLNLAPVEVDGAEVDEGRHSSARLLRRST